MTSKMVLHGARLVSPDDPSALALAMTVLDAAYAALTARQEQAASRANQDAH